MSVYADSLFDCFTRMLLFENSDERTVERLNKNLTILYDYLCSVRLKI